MIFQKSGRRFVDPASSIDIRAKWLFPEIGDRYSIERTFAKFPEFGKNF
jgi:hypothetical protein